MERHFILPVSIAAALHVGVLFGFHRVPVVRPPVEKAKYIEMSIPKELEPPEPEEAREPVDAKSPPTESIPRQAETFAAVPNAIPINMPISHAVDISTGAFTLINPRVSEGAGGLSGIISSLNLDDPPRVRSQVPPAFPTEARRDGRNGQVDVEFIVDEAGRVRDARIVRSTDRVFDEPTLHAVAKWRFEPGRAHGQIVRFRMAVPVVFNVADDR
ncbi:MAG TPA: energy transducer TonB [Opitutaceae bacterium]|nr:energy transducer TonB [Opitutaceae bacterium]